MLRVVSRCGVGVPWLCSEGGVPLTLPLCVCVCVKEMVDAGKVLRARQTWMNDGLRLTPPHVDVLPVIHQSPVEVRWAWVGASEAGAGRGGWAWVVAPPPYRSMGVGECHGPPET